IERSAAEEALRRSERRYRSVAETAHDAIITADGDGRIVSWNGAAQGMFGLAEEEAVGEPLTRIIPERFHAAHERGLARQRDGGERRVIGRTVELCGLRAGGAEFPLELSLAAWTMGPAGEAGD